MITRNGKAYLFPGMAVVAGNTYQVQARLMGSGGGYGTYGMNNMTMSVKGGSGNTPATVDDYALASQIDTLTQIANSNTQKATPRDYNDNFILTASTTYQNNTENDVTIQELGIFLTIEGYQPMMIARQVINPVILKPGKTYTFTMTIG